VRDVRPGAGLAAEAGEVAGLEPGLTQHVADVPGIDRALVARPVWPEFGAHGLGQIDILGAGRQPGREQTVQAYLQELALGRRFWGRSLGLRLRWGRRCGLGQPCGRLLRGALLGREKGVGGLVALPVPEACG
jgi:hypothetical protein